MKFITQSFLALTKRYYEEYSEKLRVSMVPLDVSRKFERVIEEVRFGLNSVKSVDLGGQTIWKRTMLRA